MAKKWLYFPFNDISKDSTMPQNRQRYQDKYGADLTVVYKGSSLAGVGDDDMLIIGGHGLPNKGEIGVKTDPGTTVLGVTIVKPTWDSLTANDLAKGMADAGLPLTHRYVKLITCGGAGMAAVNDAGATVANGKVTAITVQRHDHAAECLASALGAALGSRRYHQILVKGYPGFVDGRGAQKFVRVEGTSEFSQTRTWLGMVTGGTQLGADYWKDGTVGLVQVPSKLLNDYWFNKDGQLVRQHIKLKA